MKITPKWIRFKFEKERGNDQYSKLWEELPEESRSSMLRGIRLGTDEAPVCAITAPPNPVLITTKRLVWHSGDSPLFILLNELASVQSPEFMHKSKLELSKLVITADSGEKHTLVTAPGTTLFVLWNLLLKFTRTH